MPHAKWYENFSSCHQALVPVRSFMLHFILYHFFHNSSFPNLFRLAVHPTSLHRHPNNLVGPHHKMIEKYEKFYGKISVDSGLFLFSQLFFAVLVPLYVGFGNLLNFSLQYFYIVLGNHHVGDEKHEILHKSIKYQLDTESHMLLNIIL